MAGNCTKDNCYPDETGCNHEGCLILSDCKYYKPESQSTKQETDNDVSEFFVRIPWTGSSFGIQDLSFLTSTSPVILVGICGVASAGKTTFLATLYCLLRHGYKIGDYQFAGSQTLGGWESIAWYLSWKENNIIQFPPHTTSNAGRIPGMLHLSLRKPNGEKKEIVFTDAPGEWFDHWTFNQNDTNAEGAIWIHENADAFLLFADCEMLSGEELGKSRKQIKLVADRLKQNLKQRPLGLIWSKSDIELDEDVKKQITSHIKNSPLSYYEEFKTSVRDTGNEALQLDVCKSIEWILNSITEQINIPPLIAQKAANDMFLSKR